MTIGHHERIMMRFDRLDDWLHWQEGLHPTAMDLGLARVQDVVSAMAWPTRTFALISVAGTNGKGSSVAYLEAIYRAAGYRTGTYTSPHLQRYNERIQIDGREVGDADIMSSFARLDEARGDITITYFEYGTLAAYDQFVGAGVDVAIMEIGIGGRLDAVNVFDADVGLVTTVDIDHQKWLGDNREDIGYQKAGIFRAGRPAICGEAEPPHSVTDYAREIAADLRQRDRDFWVSADGDAWRYEDADGALRLPMPGLTGVWQQQNAAAAIAVTRALRDRLPVPDRALSKGIRAPGLRGRFETVANHPEVIVDVAHNAQATATLAANLAVDASSAGPTVAVVAMLADKDIRSALSVLTDCFERWYVAPTDGPRGLDEKAFAEELRAVGTSAGAIQTCDSTVSAFVAAREYVSGTGRVVVFGSFHTVGDVLDALDNERASASGNGRDT